MLVTKKEFNELRCTWEMRHHNLVNAHNYMGTRINNLGNMLHAIMRYLSVEIKPQDSIAKVEVQKIKKIKDKKK